MRIIEQIPTEWGVSFHYAGPIGRFRPENKLAINVIGAVLNLKAAPTVWDFVIIQKDQWLRDVQKPLGIKINTWYHVKSVMEGSDFEFYVDDDLVTSFVSNAIPTGRVGLCIGGCAAEFDNVVITGQDVPDAGPSGLAVNLQSKLATTWGQIRRE
jgi:hypothetical protein